MRIWLLVGVGGAIGAVARHAVTGMVLRTLRPPQFPAAMAILIVNVAGSGLIGLLAGVAAGGRIHVSPDWRAFLAVGVLGGFTTFSSFSLDTLTLARGGYLGQAMANVIGQVVLSLLAALVGYRVGSEF